MSIHKENFLSSPLLSKTLPKCLDTDAKFSEPWEAKAFAIIVTMAKEGYFAWDEWVEFFSQEVKVATLIEENGGNPQSYYEQWLDAAEKILMAKGLVTKEQLFAKKFSIAAVGTNKALMS